MDLREARLKKNLTQAELAQKVGVTVAMANHYEKGKHLPRPGTKRKIEAFLGPIDWPTERTQHLRVPSLYEQEVRQ